MYPNKIRESPPFCLVRCTGNNIGIMFLNEVVLGKEHYITRDDWTLTAPPVGYDSIVAKGRTEPGIYTVCIIVWDCIDIVKSMSYTLDIVRNGVTICEREYCVG